MDAHFTNIAGGLVVQIFVRRFLKIAVALILIIVVTPFLLVASDWPKRDFAPEDETLVLHRMDRTTISVEPEKWLAPDGSELTLRRYPTENRNAPLMVMLHGSGIHGGQFGHLAATLASDGVADVLAPDLRGHGLSPERRGDVDYVGQLEDDLAALIESEARPDQDVILLGHSSGGGLVVRFAGGPHGHLMDRAILLAPYLGHDAPTTRANAGGWAHPLLRRYIGLEILNGFGITALNGLKVVQFNLPDAVQTDAAGPMTLSYSYRLNTSYHPRPELGADLSRLPETLLIAGSGDEAFVADQYQPLLEDFTQLVTYHILNGIQHMNVVDAPRTAELIDAWVRQ
ncbi:MAG: alpha/beta hydrolase [Cognatishimia activa]